MTKRGSFKESVVSSPAGVLLKQSQEPTKEIKQETKSVRVNLLFRPTVKRNIEKIAHMRQTSVNDLINMVMAEYIEAHQDEIDEYNRVFGDE
jgi:allophanate hydrolase subunit 1